MSGHDIMGDCTILTAGRSGRSLQRETDCSAAEGSSQRRDGEGDVLRWVRQRDGQLWGKAAPRRGRRRRDAELAATAARTDRRRRQSRGDIYAAHHRRPTVEPAICEDDPKGAGGGRGQRRSSLTFCSSGALVGSLRRAPRRRSAGRRSLYQVYMRLARELTCTS